MNYICNNSKYKYKSGYIHLSLPDFELPEVIEVEKKVMYKKNEFHVSLVCVTEVCKNLSVSEEVVLRYFCDFASNHDINFSGFTD